MASLFHIFNFGSLGEELVELFMFEVEFTSKIPGIWCFCLQNDQSGLKSLWQLITPSKMKI